MQAAGRLGRAAVPVVSAGVAAAVTAGPAHADAPSEVECRPTFQDVFAWELADVVDSNKRVVFTPEDIDNAVASLKRPLQPAAIDQGDSSDLSSDGTVNEIIERSSFEDAEHSIVGMDSRLLTVAARLLKSPGVQQEIMSAALSDPEVFNILLGKVDQPGYLEAQGFAARGLLPGASSARSCTDIQVHDAEGDVSLLDDMAAWAVDCVEGLGFRVLALARWMKAKLTGAQQQQGPSADSSSSAAGSAAGARAAGRGSPLHRIVGGGTLALMAAMVAIVAAALLKKPELLRRVVVSAASTAGATSAASASRRRRL